MMMAAIALFAAGVMVELYAVLFAPLGYQDDFGFHPAPEQADDQASALVENPS
jgi:hypothetical protein